MESLYAGGDFYRLLATSANSFDPDQDRQNVGPKKDPIRLTLCNGFLSEDFYFLKVNIDKIQHTTAKERKIGQHVKR